MAKEAQQEPKDQNPQADNAQADDKWDQLMAKLDDITNMLREACEATPEESKEDEASKDGASEAAESDQAASQ